MLKYIIISVLLFFQIEPKAQKSAATLKTVLQTTLKENSGLTYANKKLFTVNDGKGNSFYAVDTATGQITNTIIVSNCNWEDAEAITNDGVYIYIADIGNNDGLRTELKVVRILLTAITAAENCVVTGEEILFSYADQKGAAADKDANAFDAEAFLVTANALYIFTKRRNDFKTQLYITYKTSGKHIAKPIDYFNSNGLITDVAFNATTKELYLLGYGKKHKGSFLWKFSNINEPNFLKGKPQFIQLHTQFNTEWQTEGICFIHNQLFISCETTADVKAGLYILK